MSTQPASEQQRPAPSSRAGLGWPDPSPAPSPGLGWPEQPGPAAAEVTR